MKQVHLTINVSDRKVNQLIELLSKNFGTVTVTEVDDFVVPEWHLKELDERTNDYKNNPEQALDFDQAMDDIEKEL